MPSSVSVVISYCSKEKCFIKPLLEQCIKFSDDIIVSFGTHLYDGTPEDVTYLKEMAALFNNVKFIQYKVSDETYTGMGVITRKQAYWHNMSRWTGIQNLKKHDWVLLLDCDEIPEGDKFKEWFEMADRNHLLIPNMTFKIANFWYFKEPTNRAKTVEDSVLLIHSKYLSKYNIFGDYERDYTIRQSGTRLQRQVKGVNGEIMFHHYSWCRTRKGLEHKIKNWGHANEYDNPNEIIKTIFQNDNVNDIIHYYTYDKVPNKFNINLEL